MIYELRKLKFQLYRIAFIIKFLIHSQYITGTTVAEDTLCRCLTILEILVGL